MADLAEWSGAVNGREDAPDVQIQIPLQPSPSGSSGTFLAEDGESSRWWVKPLNNLQGPMVPVMELIVARVGALIDAPVCRVEVAEIPEELAGWEFSRGANLAPGLASASMHVDKVSEGRELSHRERDHNRARHAGAMALYDWCWGEDHQWLYQLSNDHTIWSHDHGFYMLGGHPNWSSGELLDKVHAAHVLPGSTHDLDGLEIERLSNALREVTADQLCKILSQVPASWPIEDADLDAIGFFLESRAMTVASRLDGLL